jgi:hypothetical protein
MRTGPMPRPTRASVRAQLLDAAGKTAEGLAEQQRATDIHRRLAAADPTSGDMKGELASDHNREGTLQAKLGLRDASLANHGRAVDLSRELTAANPADYELRFALALALAGRADAHLLFARATRPGVRDADLTAAERDYLEAIDLYARLKAAGTFAVSDKEYEDHARAQLEAARSLAAGR